MFLALAGVIGGSVVVPVAAQAGPIVCFEHYHVEKYRSFEGREIELRRCESDHPGSYSYQAWLLNAKLGDEIALYYNPYGKGYVAGSRNENRLGDGETVATPAYYGLIGELQPCLVDGDRVIACAWS